MYGIALCSIRISHGISDWSRSKFDRRSSVNSPYGHQRSLDMLSCGCFASIHLAQVINRVGGHSFQRGAVLQYHSPVRQGGEIGIHSGLKTRRR